VPSFETKDFPMCDACCSPGLSRRSFLRLGLGGGAAVALGGCDRLPSLVSDAEVAAMGEQAWRDMRAKIPVSRNAGYREAMGEVTTRLLRAAGHSPGDWEVAVFASPQVNAFALPGNKIGVYEGMMGIFENRDQLAAVVGHEIGHVEAEHSKERISAQMASNAALRLVAWLLNIGEVEYAQEIVAALGLGAEVGVLLPYGREQEEEADVLGLRTMVRADYRADQAVRLWQVMDEVSGRRGPEFLATHPAPRSRIRNLEEAIRALQSA
jgi:predicted Zn-dependent protease